MKNDRLRLLCSIAAMIIFVAVVAATRKSTARPPVERTHASADAAPRRGRGPAAEVRMTAAELFTTDYTPSRLRTLSVHAFAAGNDCSVLLVDLAGASFDDTKIEALHYGTGPYRDRDGGVQHFYRQRSFRGVIYRDEAQNVWTFGDVAKEELPSLTPCR